MTRTITALFDSRADADAGGERLRAAGIDASNVQVHDQSTHKTAGEHSTAQDKGLWASIKNAFLPDDDRHAYEEGIRRGGFLLTADVSEDDTPAAVQALEEANSIDLDQRAAQWRAQGWAAPAPLGGTDPDTTGVFGEREADRGGTRFRSYAARPIDRRDV